MGTFATHPDKYISHPRGSHPSKTFADNLYSYVQKYALWTGFNVAQAALLSPLLFMQPALLARAGLYTVAMMGRYEQFSTPSRPTNINRKLLASPSSAQPPSKRNTSTSAARSSQASPSSPYPGSRPWFSPSRQRGR